MARPALWSLLLACAVGVAAVGFAAAPTYPMRYKFSPGDVLTYETKTLATVKLSIKVNGQEAENRLPLGMDVVGATRYEVKAVGDDGAATVEARLARLGLNSTVPGLFALNLERDGQEVVVTGGKVDHQRSPAPETGKGTPAEIVAGFGGWDPVTLATPYTLKIKPSGQVTVAAGTPWVQRMVAMPTFGQLALYFQPFGPALLELPGRNLELGAEWEQARDLPMPGANGTYQLDVLFALENKQPVGKFDAARIGFEGAVALQDKPIKLAVPGTGMVDMLMETLTHHLRGDVFFAYDAGRLLEQHLKSEVNAICTGGPNKNIRIESGVNVDASMLLLKP